MPKTGQSKGHTFLNVPDHVYSEIVELNGVEFKSHPLVLEEAKAKNKDCTPDNQNSVHHQFINYYLNITHQHEQQQEHQHHGQQRYTQRKRPQQQSLSLLKKRTPRQNFYREVLYHK